MATAWPRRLWPLLMLGVPAGTVAIWAVSGGHRLPWLAAAASLTGLGAALMVLYQVILIARFAPLERTYGQSTLTRAHRWSGAAFLSLMIMHIVVITLAHAEAGLIAAVTGLARFVGAVPVMTLAAVASLHLPRRCRVLGTGDPRPPRL